MSNRIRMTEKSTSIRLMGEGVSEVGRSAPLPRYRMGELAEHTGLSRQTLHNYTRWGLIREVGWTAGGHRVYDEQVFERLSRIIELKRTCSMAEIREILDTLPPTLRTGS